MATVGALNVVLNAVTRKFIDGMSKAQEQVESLDASTNQLSDSFKEINTQSEMNGKAMNGSVKDSEKMSEAIGKQKKQFEEMNVTIDASESSFMKLIRVVSGVSNAVTAMTNVFEVLADKDKLSKGMEKVTDLMGKFKTKVKETSETLKNNESRFKGVKNGFDKISGGIDKFKNKSMGFASKIMKNINLTKLFSTALIAGGIAIVGLIAFKALSAITSYSKKVTEATLKQIEFAKSLKLTSQQITFFNASAKAMGASSTDITNSIKGINKITSETVNGVGDMGEEFTKLGIDVNKFNELPTEKKLLVLVDRIKNIDNEFEKNQTFKKFGGDSLMLLGNIDNLNEKLKMNSNIISDLAIVQSTQAEAYAMVAESTKESEISANRLSKATSALFAPFADLFNFIATTASDSLSTLFELASVVIVPLSKLTQLPLKFLINPLATVMGFFRSSKNDIKEFSDSVSDTGESFKVTTHELKGFLAEADKIKSFANQFNESQEKILRLQLSINKVRADGGANAIADLRKLNELLKLEKENIQKVVNAQGEKNNAKRLEKMFSSSGLDGIKDFKALETEMERIRKSNLTAEEKINEQIRSRMKMLEGLAKLEEKSGKSQIKNEMILMEDITNLEKQLKEQKDKGKDGFDADGTLGQEIDSNNINTDAIAQSGIIKDSQKQVNEQKQTNSLLGTLIEIFKQYDLGLA